MFKLKVRENKIQKYVTPIQHKVYTSGSMCGKMQYKLIVQVKIDKNQKSNKQECTIIMYLFCVPRDTPANRTYVTNAMTVNNKQQAITHHFLRKILTQTIHAFLAIPVSASINYTLTLQ